MRSLDRLHRLTALACRVEPVFRMMGVPVLLWLGDRLGELNMS